MQTIQVHSRVGKDGVLSVKVPVGPADANTEVMITIQPLTNGGPPVDATEWHQFVEETYGSCADLGLERPEPGHLEDREPLE